MDSKEFREAAVSSIDEIISYYDNIGERNVVSTVEPGYLRKLLPSEAPADGEPWSDIQQDIEGKILPGITHWQHPGFHAFFPCATSYPSILGELYSAALSGACFNWICSPAVTELETIVLDWLAKILGLPTCYLSMGPTRGGGVIQGSASEAVLTAMVAARDKYLRETTPAGLEGDALEDAIAHKRSRMVALATSMTHSSTKKAAIILGVRFITIPVSAEDGYALTGPVLAAALENCRARGLEPFFLTATLGTTDTCAVDDFDGISSSLADFVPAGSPGEVWVHIDAAYAGAALVCPEVQEATEISLIDRFHSFDMNMHKWLLTNFDASCLFVRDREWFTRALTINQAVYSNTASDGGLVTDYREWQIPLGRRFRSLKIWFVMRSYGVNGLQAYIRRTTQLGEDFASWLRARPGLFEILTGPSFALTVFRMVGKDTGECNARTKKLCDRVNATGKMWVTSTLLDGRFAIRMMTGVRTTEKEHVEAAFQTLAENAEDVLKTT
ncbi:pyridoxal phosphate-dependent transferase [Lasiosphaeris hirsuta]|uniref:Pyridoxal phosphate-dependent transferase n=1 Tax=Lasiosphaeris hirsuta TaxID=260670 RepID=A0AA40AHC1_9PEZI|nr:pyridoxal phosphate-dependent transferase [Lasiosphaeris hirsuta]